MKEKNIKTYKPKLEDLWFRQDLLQDEDTMSFNHAWGGVISFTKDIWDDWYNFWLIDNEDKRFYRYLMNEDNVFIGEIAYHYDKDNNMYLANIIIHSKYRNLGYGSKGLDLLCKIAKENGIKTLYDDIAIDNKAIKLFIKHRFIEEKRTDKIILLKKEL